MTRALALAFALAAGCSGTLVSVRMDVPSGAEAHIAAGVYTPDVKFATPFVGQFESGSVALAAGFPIAFDLEAEAARRYGAEHPIRIYGRLNVGKPTEFAKNQTLRLAPSEERIKALVRGEVSEISAFVADPNEPGQPRLATVVLRMAPF